MLEGALASPEFSINQAVNPARGTSYESRAISFEGGGDTAKRSPLDVLRPEQVLIDETVAVAADGHYSKEFELPSDRPVRIIAEGVQGTGNGFSVHCVEPHELSKLKARQQFRYLPDLGARKFQKFDHTSRLPAGRYVIVVTNTENWFFTMQVRIRIVINPK